MPAKVISFINLKGGVSKTTTAVGTAIAFAEHYGKKVLVIDLDPQTNATAMLIGEERWSELDREGLTIYELFNGIMEDRNPFSLRGSIQKNVGNIKDAPGIDLLPSSIKILYLQDELYDVSYYGKDPYRILDYAIGPVMRDYDFVLIDCPPNLGILTLNGLQISNGYVIPAIPDILSTYGVPQIMNRIDKFAQNRGLRIVPLGIVFTKVKNNGLHTRRQSEIRDSLAYSTFDTIFRENARYAEAAEFTEPMTFRQKWGGTNLVTPFFEFCAELMEKVR